MTVVIVTVVKVKVVIVTVVTVVIVTLVTLVTVKVVTVAFVTVVMGIYFSINYLTPQQQMRCSEGSVSQFLRCFWQELQLKHFFTSIYRVIIGQTPKIHTISQEASKSIKVFSR